MPPPSASLPAHRWFIAGTKNSPAGSKTSDRCRPRSATRASPVTGRATSRPAIMPFCRRPYPSSKDSDMTPDQLVRAAAALANARKGPAIASLPADGIPWSEADSYQIQDAVIAKLGEKIGGWKVGISPLGGHVAAPIFASAVFPSPASLPARGFKIIGIECEIGFRFNKALPPRPQPYTRQEVLDAASLHPTIEIVDSRYQDFRALDRLITLADNINNGALVYGPA